MSPLRSGMFGVAICLSMITGCASAPAVYGQRARFSPAYQGYVMAAHDGSDDPGREDAVLLLRDPVSGKKLRCREEVVEWRELHEDLALDELRDHRAGIAAGVAASLIFGPVAALQPVGSLAVVEGLYTTGGLYNLLRSESAPELVAAGIRLYDRKRYPQSSLCFEHALAKDGSIGVESTALYFLGLAYKEQGKQDRATMALTEFLEKAAVRDADGYRGAEAALTALGAPREPCASTEPVDLHW